MRLKIKGRYQDILLIDEEKSFGVVVQKGVKVKEELIKFLKKKSPKLMNLDLWNIQHFCPVQHDCKGVSVISNHILQSQDQVYFLNGVLYYYDGQKTKVVSWTLDHEITPFGEVKSLSGLPFFLLFHTPIQKINKGKLKFLNSQYKPKEDKRFTHIHLKKTEFYIGDKVIIAKKHRGRWTKVYHVDEGSKYIPKEIGGVKK